MVSVQSWDSSATMESLPRQGSITKLSHLLKGSSFRARQKQRRAPPQQAPAPIAAALGRYANWGKTVIENHFWSGAKEAMLAARRPARQVRQESRASAARGWGEAVCLARAGAAILGRPGR